MEIQTDHDEIFHAYPPPAQGRFWCRFDPHPLLTWAWGPKILKAEGDIFENCLQNKRCPAGCKLTLVPQLV